jgi:hypothetical protein
MPCTLLLVDYEDVMSLCVCHLLFIAICLSSVLVDVVVIGIQICRAVTCIQPLVVGVNGELVFRPVELNLDHFSLEDLVGQDHDAERLEELQ